MSRDNCTNFRDFCPDCGTLMEPDFDDESASCPHCGAIYEIYYSERYDEWNVDPDNKLSEDFDDDDEDSIPSCCRACGGPYPSCMTSCKIFDD